MSEDALSLSVATHLADFYLLSAARMRVSATDKDLGQIYGGIFLLAWFLESKPREMVHDLLDPKSDRFDSDFKNKFEEMKAVKKQRPFDRDSVLGKFTTLADLRAGLAFQDSCQAT
jgi:hypothetical protein